MGTGIVTSLRTVILLQLTEIPESTKVSLSAGSPPCARKTAVFRFPAGRTNAFRPLGRIRVFILLGSGCEVFTFSSFSRSNAVVMKTLDFDI